jgi:hypothetical protein
MEFLVQSTLVSSTGMARDSVSNSICVQQNDGDGDEFLFDFAGALWGFYAGTAPGALTNVSALMSPVLSRVADAHTIDVYDINGKLDGTPHGSPVFSLPFSINPTLPASTALPSEVAVCLTIEALGRADEPVERPDGADAGTAVDRPRQRSTGRMYIGPLAASTVAIVGGVARPDANIRDTVRLAAVDMFNKIDALDVGVRPVVWSRKDAQVRPVAAVSIDNAFDIQRRRGEEPTLRTRTAL